MLKRVSTKDYRNLKLSGTIAGLEKVKKEREGWRVGEIPFQEPWKHELQSMCQVAQKTED